MPMQTARISARAACAAALLAVALGSAPAHAQVSAVDPARAAAHAHPSDVNASIALGKALRRAGRDREALAELRRGASTVSGRRGPGAIAVHWEIARTYIAERNFAQAMVACRVVGAQTGGAAAGHACAAEAHLLWRRASEALGETAAALAGGNKSYDAKVSEGRAYALQLKDAQAEASFRAAIGWKPDAPEAHLYLGRFLVDTHKTDQGIPELRKAAQLDPSGPEAAYELGRALGATADGLAALQRATRERPGFLKAWVKLAEVDLALGKTTDARVAAQAALKIAGQDASAHIVVGRVDLAEGKVDEALAEARTALGVLANSAGAKLLMADAYAKKGEIDLALEAYQAAASYDRLDPAPLVHAAEACIKAQRLTSARAYAQKVTKDFADWGPGWVALGDTLAADHDPAGARAAYTKALQSKGPVDAAAVRAKLARLR